mmetsp:Transcript_31657/g.48548  ORF Transcript_31657/g.48548 Transcript_31657/m.48548 type:complete len:285 (+) Transcript_31657:106-960(+)
MTNMTQVQQSGIPSTITLSASCDNLYGTTMTPASAFYPQNSSKQQRSANHKRKRESSSTIPQEIEIKCCDKKLRLEDENNIDFDDDIFLWNTNNSENQGNDEGSLTWLTIQSFDPESGVGMKQPEDDEISKALEFAENDWDDDCQQEVLIHNNNTATFASLPANSTIHPEQDTVIYIPNNNNGGAEPEWDDISDISHDSSVCTLEDQSPVILPSSYYFTPSPLPFCTTIQDYPSKIFKPSPVSVTSSVQFGNPLLASTATKFQTGLVQVHADPSLRRYSLDCSF